MIYKSTLLLIFSLVCSTIIMGQTRIDNQISFQTDPQKQYSVFVPSSYDEDVPNKLMVALHPLNTNRWNSISWCDTLIAFAEQNDLILICPDGGADGKVDDPIDTAFTTFIIDSTLLWYNIDESKIFAMGFSWGARTTYTYGLNHVDRFAGFLPIGAAITNTNEVNGVTQNAANKPFYLVHGTQDSPNTRFYPILDALNMNEACVNFNLMTGIGHTIDFPNRNEILTEAFNWIDSVSCGIINGLAETDFGNQIEIFPNPIQKGDFINITVAENDTKFEHLEILDLSGKVILNQVFTNKISTQELNKGIYFLRLLTKKQLITKKIIIQ
jgi:predicted esterase